MPKFEKGLRYDAEVLIMLHAEKIHSTHKKREF